jgi:ribonuclease P protein component
LTSAESAAREVTAREEDVPAAQHEPQAHPRIPVAHGHAARPQRSICAPAAGAQAARRRRGSQMKLEGLPTRARLRRRSDFLRVQTEGHRHHLRGFVVHALRSGAPDGLVPGMRMGITVTRRVGGAVVRTRLRRLVREAFRRMRRDLPPGWDTVWVAKRGAHRLEYRDVLGDMTSLAQRLARS